MVIARTGTYHPCSIRTTISVIQRTYLGTSSQFNCYVSRPRVRLRSAVRGKLRRRMTLGRSQPEPADGGRISLRSLGPDVQSLRAYGAFDLAEHTSLIGNEKPAGAIAIDFI